MNNGLRAGLVRSPGLIVESDGGISAGEGARAIGNGIAIGTGALAQFISTGGGGSGLNVSPPATNIAIGASALGAKTAGVRNVAIGGAALAASVGSLTGVGAQNQGDDNVAIGDRAASALTTGFLNVMIGSGVASNATTARQSVGIGTSAFGTGINTGTNNVAIGHLAMRDTTSAYSSVGVGYGALLRVTDGYDNTAIGSLAGSNILSGFSNVAVGMGALQANTASNNTAVGTSALATSTTNAQMTAFGYRAGNTDGTTATPTTGIAYATCLGHEAQAVVSNVCIIGSKLAAGRQSLCIGNYGELGGGKGLISLSDAVTVPTTNPTGGGLLYSDAGRLKWRGSGGAVNTLAGAFKMFSRNTGDLTLNSVTWSDLPTIGTSWDITLPAAVGDVIAAEMAALVDVQPLAAMFDVATIVAGSPVNYFACAGGASDLGVSNWYAVASGQSKSAGTWKYALVAGDISGDTVTLRLRYRTAVAANKILFAQAILPFQFSAANLGPVAA